MRNSGRQGLAAVTIIRRNVGAIGVTGTPGANILAREADLIIGIGTRYSDFTTASKTAFQNPSVRFVNINVSRIRRLQARRHCADRRCPRQRSKNCSTRSLDYKVEESYQTKIVDFPR